MSLRLEYFIWHEHTEACRVSSSWVHVSDMFWGLHCAFYTPTGRSYLASELQSPFDMQIDSLYGSLSKFDNLRVLAQVEQWTARQSIHVSTIQVAIYESSTVKKLVIMIIIIVTITCCVLKLKRSNLNLSESRS